ncbi:Bud-site selection protein [Nemania sp. FL0916]|nr:Bud-site selection protein [Nemania sp. FL0916]
MPKRKRGEPSLEEKLAKWKKELVRGLKTAKGFERQRLSKRIREADAEKTARLEREVLVLKSLDLHQAAHAHLCSSLLKIKGVAESPKLPADIKPVAKPELSEDEKTALHNVTSALCNRKQVKDVIEEAVMGTCIALRVPMPEKKGKTKNKQNTIATEDTKARRNEERVAATEDLDSPADDESEDAEEPEFEGPPLLRRKIEKDEGEDDLESKSGSDGQEEPEFEGFSDSDAEEAMFSKYDDLVGGSSDEDEEDEDGDDNNNESDRADSRSKSIRKLALDDISLSSEASDDSENSEDDALAPPSKKAKASAVKPVTFNPGNSTFLPSLMGGYISGSESASDVDVAPPPRKNRRGQRARQAIWEKKYGEKAKHYQKENSNDSRSAGWDMKRGAVDADGDAGKPWKKGIRNPFENKHIHPDRQRQMQSDGSGDHQARSKESRAPPHERQRPGHRDNDQAAKTEVEKKPPPRTRDDTGALHPSWAAAKKAKEGGQKVEFQGKKVTFD